MAANTEGVPNPKRFEAGRLSRQKWRGFTAEVLERLRQSALTNKPWLHSTGPRTPTDKAQAVLNGKKRQLGPRCVREIRADLRECRNLLHEMRTLRGSTQF